MLDGNRIRGWRAMLQAWRSKLPVQEPVEEPEAVLVEKRVAPRSTEWCRFGEVGEPLSDEEWEAMVQVARRRLIAARMPKDLGRRFLADCGIAVEEVAS